MVLIQPGEDFVFNFLHHEVVLLDNPDGANFKHNAAREELAQCEGCGLVVNDFPLVGRSLNRCELPSHAAVPDGYLTSLQGEQASCPDNLHTDRHHH